MATAPDSQRLKLLREAADLEWYYYLTVTILDLKRQT